MKKWNQTKIENLATTESNADILEMKGRNNLVFILYVYIYIYIYHKTYTS